MHAPHECTIHGAGQEQVPLELLSSSHLITNQISAVNLLRCHSHSSSQLVCVVCMVSMSGC